ncbi:MAG: rhodanese-like domain-containing protein [Thermoplasmatales archaeon]|nr:MAG: rhodanese-like domain-containing protein [Thermoplasmatales archaeon]
MKKFIIATFVIVIMLVSSGVSISATNKYSSFNSMTQTLNECPVNITVHEAWNLLTDTGNGIQIPIDVRTDAEWNSGYIDTPWPECPIWYVKDLFQNETWLPTFMEMYDGEDIVLYCKGGYRSYLVSIILCDAGFSGTVYNMLGGITDWVAQGYPIRNNTQPDAPTIDGPTTVKVNQPIDYTFSTADAEGDGIYYWIDWCGEGHCGEWIGPFSSEDQVIFNHSWERTGTFTTKAKVKDFYDNESDWTEFEITVPRNKVLNLDFLELLFIKFPYAFSVIKYILGL